MHPALARLLTKADDPGLLETLAARLSNGELTTLLLEVFSRKAEAIRPHELLNGLAQNRFIAPAPTDPITLRRAEATMLELSHAAGFRPVELSPLAPLGASAVYGRVSQHKVLSALRGCEVVSDPTNAMLPLMVAELCNKQNPLPELHWAAAQRVVCANLMTSPDAMPHFALYAAVSLLRSKDPKELVETVLKHLRLQRAIYTGLGLEDIQLRIYAKGIKKHYADALLVRLAQENEFEFRLESSSGTPYYEGFQIKTWIHHRGQEAEIADCGFVDWAARLKGDARLHAFISGIGIERLLNLAAAP